MDWYLKSVSESGAEVQQPAMSKRHKNKAWGFEERDCTAFWLLNDDKTSEKQRDHVQKYV